MLRQVFVRSMNPTGVKVASPIFNWSGEVSLAGGPAGAGANAAFATLALGFTPDGMIGVVEATSPKLGRRPAVSIDASAFDGAAEPVVFCFASSPRSSLI